MTSINESRNALRFTNGPSVGRGKPTEIVIHHWGADGQTHEGILDWFCNNQSVGTSAHLVVSANKIHCIVNLTDVAWHAGDWAANVRSIGIECRPEATEADYATVAETVRWLRSLYGNLPLRAHKQYAQTSCPGRYDLAKIDRLANAGVVAPAASTEPKPVAPKPAPAKAPAGTFVATVDPGDTLTSIARQFGTTVNAIVAVNKGINPNKINVGQKLNIPITPAKKPSIPQYCWVDPGDSLERIGVQFGVPWTTIAKLNGLKAPYVIHPGQKLRLW